MMGAAIAALVSAAFSRSWWGTTSTPSPSSTGRLARLTVIGLGVYLVGISIAWGSLPVALASEILLLLACPLLLYASGFFLPGEMDRLRPGLLTLRRGPTALLQRRRSSK